MSEVEKGIGSTPNVKEPSKPAIAEPKYITIELFPLILEAIKVAVTIVHEDRGRIKVVARGLRLCPRLAYNFPSVCIISSILLLVNYVKIMPKKVIYFTVEEEY